MTQFVVWCKESCEADWTCIPDVVLSSSAQAMLMIARARRIDPALQFRIKRYQLGVLQQEASA